jgi:hypothetical protein
MPGPHIRLGAPCISADVLALETAIKGAAHTFIPPRKSFGMLLDHHALGGGGPIEATLKTVGCGQKRFRVASAWGRVTAQR